MPCNIDVSTGGAWSLVYMCPDTNSKSHLLKAIIRRCGWKHQDARFDFELRHTAVSHLTPLKFDIAILGGGILGSATAYFLLKESPTLSLCVIEPDPTYEFASTLRASGGCRVQFTCPENIAMSLYSIVHQGVRADDGVEWPVRRLWIGLKAAIHS